MRRVNQSFLFFGDGGKNHQFPIPVGSLLTRNHDEKKISDCFEHAERPLKDSGVYRPGMDVTKATLVGRRNWRGREKIETVGSWKSKVYEVRDVVFSFKEREVVRDQIVQLELKEDSKDVFLVAKRSSVSESRNSSSYDRLGGISRFSFHESRNPSITDRVGEIPRSSVSESQNFDNSSFVGEDGHRDFVPFSNEDKIQQMLRMETPGANRIMVVPPIVTKERQYTKSVQPVIWLTEDFPLKTEELMPLLDILANKVKAVRRMRELLTATFPPGTFPVKVAIPVVTTVRVVITFKKFVELQEH